MLRSFFGVLFLCLTLPSQVSAMPAGMSDVCKAEYQKYQNATGPKAFAKGTTKGCGWRGNRKSIVEAKQGAVDYCVQYKGDNCKVVESAN